jgi:signal transduction histidine kinase
MVGHDIRNPLQAILGDMYLLQSDIDEMAEGKSKQSALETIKGINDNIAYINKIIVDLQDFAKKNEPALVEVSLGDAINEAFSTINIPKNIDADCLIEPNLTLKTDPSYIRRIITNLSTNAIQAMPIGGKLTVEAHRGDGNKVRITVTDTGEGIPEDIQDRVFKPLFTTKSKGQGFGLAVVKKFVEELGGTITFESQLGKGTKFTMEWPSESR